MCGINVIQWSTPLTDETQVAEVAAEMRLALARMQAALIHRGPDQQGTAMVKDDLTEILIGASRLSLRGGEAGNQPLIGKDGLVLAYNGELFGPDIQGSDTEALFNHLSDRAIDHLDFLQTHDGMGAYVWVKPGGRSILERDSFGVKPLWMGYSGSPRASLISSEVRALSASQHASMDADARRLPELLAYRCVHGQAGLFSSIELLPPGNRWDFDAEDYFDYSKARPGFQEQNFQPNQEEIKDALHASLLQNLTSDRPVGLMLSGGIDSGLLACLAAEAGVKLPCFTTEGPESEQAARLAKRLGHSVVKVPVPRGTTDWLEMLRHSPAPIADPGGYMTWCVARAAKAEGVPVLLSGAGADEVWLGYRRHAFWHARQGWLNSRLFKLAAPLLHKVDSRFSQAASGDPMAVYRKTMAAPGNLADFLGLPEPSLSPLASHIPHLLWLDLFTYLPDQVLLATDLYSMAHSVEVRVPYLTRKMVGMAWALGPDALLKEGPKTPLRKLFAQYGGEIGKKTGFGPSPEQYPDFREMDAALGLDKASHPIYAHLPFERVADWRRGKMGLQARMAFWCAGMQMGYEWKIEN